MPDWFYDPKTEEEKRKVRVLIAKDALQWVRGTGFFRGANVPRPNFGTGDTYMRFRAKVPSVSVIGGKTYEFDKLTFGKYPGEDELQNVLMTDVKSCDVCAIGGLFVADVLKNNKMTIAEYTSSSRSWLYRILRAFTVDERYEIESHFEDTCVDKYFSKEALFYRTPKTLAKRFEMWRNMDFEVEEQAVFQQALQRMYGDSWRNTTTNEVSKYRFIAICENIIDNGSFMPNLGVRRRGAK